MRNIFLPFVIVISFVLGGISFPIVEQKFQKESFEQPVEIPQNHEVEDKIDMEKLEKVYDLIQEKFVDTEKWKQEEISEWMIRALLYSLDDPHSDFFNEEQSEEFEKSMQGDLEGIGAKLTKKHGSLVIEDVLKNTPAAKAGVLPDDVILEVDGKSVENETVWDTVMRIRGEKGTTVKLSVFRDGEDEKLEFEIVRETIHVESVVLSWQGKEKNIAVLEVSQFGDDTSEMFEKYYREALLKNPKGFIVDLRYNTGGYLEKAVDLASYFLPEKTKVVTITSKNNISMDYFTEKKNGTTLPLVILVNAGSASASEIFAGAMQDMKRGQLVGTKTFGKGSVQQIFPLEKGEEVKLTIAKWVTPNGKNPTKEQPIFPDIDVENPKRDPQSKEDPKDIQMEKAVEVLDSAQ